MKAIVFGGSGFLGSHVADALTEKGFDVTIFDLKESLYQQENQKMIVGDLADQNKVREAIKGCDYVYHFAGIADIKEAQNRPIDTVKSNILSTMYILDSCREFNVKRFVFASTIYVYSEHGSFYRSSKQSCELFIENYQKIYGVNFTVLRFGSLYGRRANKFNFINKIIEQAFLEGKIERQGDGNEIRDYVNVLDAAKASVDILSKDYENSYVMITGSQTMKVRDLLDMVNEMFDNKIKIEYLEGKFEEHYEITPYSFRPRVAKKLVPQYYHDLGQGILDSIYDVYKRLEKEDKTNQIKISSAKISNGSF